MLCAVMAFSQSPADTLPKISTQNISEVEIWTYSPIPSYIRTTNLTDALQRNQGNSLTDVLQENTGIYLKNYGPGMLSTIAFRGTGAEHTALVWNGLNINYPMLGLADFAVIPANGFTQASLLHGSNSNVFGSSAIGGAVAIGNSPEYTTNYGFNYTGIKTTATFETGSYNRYLGAVTNFVGTRKFNSRTTLQWLDAENDFKFTNEFKFGKPVERQQNSAIEQRVLMQDFDIVTGKHSMLSFNGWYNFTDRQIPPSLTAVNTNAQQKDESLRGLVTYKMLFGNHHTTIQGAFVRDFIGYKDVYLSSDAIVSTSTIKADHYYRFAKRFDARAGIEGQYFSANVDDYQAIKTEWRISAFATVVYYSRNKRLQASAGYRQIFVQGHITSAAPTVGASYIISEKGNTAWGVKASISRSYRVPTLNERYWVPGGNANLKAEGGWNYELGTYYTYTKNIDEKQLVKINTEATGFAMLIDNWLQWQPTNLGYWQPANLKQVFSRGAEFTFNLLYKNSKFEVGFNTAYTLAIATNLKAYNNANTIIDRDLIYTPRNVASTGLTLSYYGYNLFTNVQYTGLRYTTTDNSQSINGYVLLNLRASKDIKLKNFTLSIWAQALNAANSTYYNLLYRPMPLRNYKLGISVSFEKIKK